MNKNIVLTGLMGSGKTTVGKILADRLGYTFVDTDDIIEQKEGISINNIFKTKGEKYFRSLENEVCRELSNRKNLVISTGGGIVLNKENIYFLRNNGVVVNLTAAPEKLRDRLKHTSNRPLLKNGDILNMLKNLLKERKEYYKNADFFIDTDFLSPEKVADKILQVLKTEEKWNIEN